jgi:hypothetical protein
VYSPSHPISSSLTIYKSALSSSTDSSSAELTAVVDELLNQINTKFSTVSSELLAKSQSYLSLPVSLCIEIGNKVS